MDINDPLITTTAVMALALAAPMFHKGDGMYGNDMVRFVFFFAVALMGTQDLVHGVVLGMLALAYLKTAPQSLETMAPSCNDIKLTDLYAAYNYDLDKLKEAVNNTTLSPQRKILLPENAPTIARHLAATTSFECM